MVLKGLHVVSAYPSRGRNRLTIDRHVEFLFLDVQFQGATRGRYTGSENFLDRTNVAPECAVKYCYCKYKNDDVEDRLLHF